jgi:hypothetical protein
MKLYSQRGIVQIALYSCFFLLFLNIAEAQSHGKSKGHCKFPVQDSKEYQPEPINTESLDEAVDTLTNALNTELAKQPALNSAWTKAIVDTMQKGTKEKVKQALEGLKKGLGPPKIKSKAYYNKCKDEWANPWAGIDGRSSFTFGLGSVVDVGGTVGYSGSAVGDITYEIVNPVLDPTEGTQTTVKSTVKWSIKLTINLGFKPGVNVILGCTVTGVYDKDHEQVLKLQ